MKLFAVSMVCAAAIAQTPLPVSSGGTGSSTTTGWSANLDYQITTSAPSTLPVQAKLSQHVNIADFGGTCTGSSDDTTALQNAITYLGNAGGVIEFPNPIVAGHGVDCGLNQSINLPQSVSLVGFGLTQLHAIPTGSFSNYYDGSNYYTYLIQLGPGPCGSNCPDDYSFLEHLHIDGRSTVQTGIYSHTAQELTYIEHAFISGVKSFGIDYVSSGAQNTFIKDVECTLFASTGVGTCIRMLAADNRISIDNITVNLGTSGSDGPGPGIELAGFAGSVGHVHCEYLSTCIMVDTASQAEVHDVQIGPNNGTFPTAVYVANGASSVEIQDVGNNGQPNAVTLVNDQINNPTVPVKGYWLATYSTGYAYGTPAIAGLITTDYNTTSYFHSLRADTINPTVADWKPVTYSVMGGAPNGAQVYCSDCKVTSSTNNTCTSGGTGAMAFYIAGAYKCLQ